jgi:hypothetical protein
MWAWRCARIGWERHGRLTERAWYAAAEDAAARGLVDDDDLDGLSGKEMERAKLGAMPPPIELAGVCLRRAWSLLIKRRSWQAHGTVVRAQVKQQQQPVVW